VLAPGSRWPAARRCRNQPPAAQPGGGGNRNREVWKGIEDGAPPPSPYKQSATANRRPLRCKIIRFVSGFYTKQNAKKMCGVEKKIEKGTKPKTSAFLAQASIIVGARGFCFTTI